jgi:hypothetical protein
MYEYRKPYEIASTQNVRKIKQQHPTYVEYTLKGLLTVFYEKCSKHQYFKRGVDFFCCRLIVSTPLYEQAQRRKTQREERR